MKACEKKVWHLRHPESGIFAEAYFVLREDVSMQTPVSDMIKEAERIIRKESADQCPKKEKERQTILLPFFAGAVLSAVVTVFVCLMI